MRPLLLVPILAALVACSMGADSGESEDDVVKRRADLRPELAQVNDVSILYPLPDSAEDLDALLSASIDARGGPLLPKVLYEDAFGVPGAAPVGPMFVPPGPAHASLRLVAARFDPCFAALGTIDDASCTNHVRLIFQTVTAETGAADTAVHAFYALSRQELKDSVQQAIAIRRTAGDDRLGALGPHPRMKSQGLKGPAATAINALIKNIAGTANLARITVFTQNGMGQRWNFSGFDIANGTATRMKIPNLPEDAPLVSFFAGLVNGDLTGDPAFTPAATGAKPEDNMQLLGNSAKATAEPSLEKRQAAFDAAVRIENPTLHSPNTVDCASCHSAEPTRRIVGETKLGLSLKDPKNLFVANAKFVPKADLALGSVDTRGVDVHMFSYKGKVASIHQRTVSESAAVVAYLNANVLDARRR